MSALTRRQLLLGAACLAPSMALRTGRAEAAQRPPLVSAMAAKRAFESYGMNCHLTHLTDSSWQHTDAAVDRVLELGVGAVRQYLPRNTYHRDALKAAMDRPLATRVQWCCPVIQIEDATSLAQARRLVNDQLDWLQANINLARLDSLPGPNEPNADRKAIEDWAIRTRWAMRALWEETRRRPAFDNVLVQGPPLQIRGGILALAPDVAELGDLSQWMDRGDAHLYPADHDPEFQVAERLEALRPVHPDRPVCVSEGGYSTSIGRDYQGRAALVPEDVASLYAPKQMLVHLIGGRTFFAYELLDEPPPYRNDVTTLEAGYGMVATPSRDPSTWRRKPGFEAMRRLLDLVRDVRGGNPVPLRVQVTATADMLRTALLHRSDGKHLLAIWQAVDLYEWDHETLLGRYLPVPPLSVTITLDEALPVAVYEPSTRDTPVRRVIAATLTQSLGAGVQVLEIG